jgi:hypothetical protein
MLSLTVYLINYFGTALEVLKFRVTFKRPSEIFPQNCIYELGYFAMIVLLRRMIHFLVWFYNFHLTLCVMEDVRYWSCRHGLCSCSLIYEPHFIETLVSTAPLGNRSSPLRDWYFRGIFEPNSFTNSATLFHVSNNETDFYRNTSSFWLENQARSRLWFHSSIMLYITVFGSHVL